MLKANSVGAEPTLSFSGVPVLAAIGRPLNWLASVRDVACGLRRDCWPGYYVTMLKAFVDDSGSGGESPWFVLAGYVGTVEGWDAFDPQWRAALDAPPRIQYFKGHEAESLRPDGQWSGVTKEERDKKIDALVEIIHRYAHRAIYIRVRQKDYDDIIKEYVPCEWDNAYYYLFQCFVAAAMATEKYLGSGDPLDFVFDSHESFQKPSERLYGYMQCMEQFAGRIINVSYRDEKRFLPLQAADLLAWQVRRFFCRPNEPRRLHFDRATTCSQPSYSYVMGKTDLKDVATALEQGVKNMAASLGIPVELVKTWERNKK